MAGEHRPTAGELEAFLKGQSEFENDQITTTVQADPAVPAGSGQPAGTWIIQTKLTLTPRSDFLIPVARDAPMAAECDQLDEAHKEQVAWTKLSSRNPFVSSRYPDLEVSTIPETPTLLTVRNPRGQAFQPVYMRFAAVWQVDRWHFSPAGVTDSPDFSRLGEPRVSYPAEAVVVGSPEAQALLSAKRQAVSDAREQREKITNAYRTFLDEATRPSTRYIGQLVNPGGSFAAEIRFVSVPTGGAVDAEVGSHPIAFDVLLPGHADYGLSFVGKLNPTVPPEPLESDLTAHCTKRRGQAGNTLLGGIVMTSTTMYSGPEEKPFSFNERELKGIVSGFQGDYRFTGSRVP